MARDIRNGYEVVKKWDDWALIDRGEYGYVVAHYPNYDDAGNVTDWAHGHYFTDFFNATNYVQGEIANTKVISVNPELEEKIVYFCKDELEWHLNNAGPEEYQAETEAEIELLTLLGYSDEAHEFNKIFEEKMKDPDPEPDV